MRMKKKICGIFIFLFVMATTPAFSADDGQKLFVNLSSDEINRAAMAIGFSTKVLTDKKIPVTIFLNVEGARIADKNIPENKYVSGKSLREMLAIFVKAGGRVIICPMCMNNVAGINKDELVEGVEVGGPEVTWPILFAKGTTVLSY